MIMPRLTSRAVLRLAPLDPEEDVVAFVQGLVTNDVKLASDTAPVYAALLSPQGKMLFDFFVRRTAFEHGPGLLIDCEAALADELAKRLSLYRLRRKIEIAREDGLGVGWQTTPAGEANDPRLPALGLRKILPIAQLGDAADKAYLALRLAHGVPETREEMGDILWLETNAGDLAGVSFSKGCYIGQENTARMNWRQKINRRLVVLPIERSQDKRQRAAYPELGLAVDHLRVADITPELRPAWMTLTPED